MQANLLVHCQYFENYNLDGRVPHWKAKGGHTFKVPVNSDSAFYADEEILAQAIQNLVESQNTIAERFEYIEHELVTSEPTVLEGLEAELDRLYRLQY